MEEESRSNATAVESIRYQQSQEDRSALSQMASVLQTSPWIVATVACLLYSVVILFILLALVLCKRLVEQSNPQEPIENNSICQSDEEQLISEDEDDEPPSYEEVTKQSSVNKTQEVV